MTRTLGPFTLHEVIGRGGYATVWRGIHRAQRVPVAVKVLRPEGARDARFVSALRREARLVAGLDHPNIVALLDHGVVRSDSRADDLAVGSPYLVMDLGRHGTLADRVGALSWAEVQTVLLALLDALSYAHARGIVHRDLKPSNVLWGPSAHHVQLVDLGIATAEDAGITRGVFGTPTFMAPEQLVTVGWRVGPWTDLFGLGVLAWALLTRLLPWSDRSITEARSSRARPLPALEPRIALPDGVVHWVRWLLEPEPADRPASAAEARRGLAEVTGVPVDRVGPQTRSHPVRPLLVGAGLSLVRLREARLVGRDATCAALWRDLRAVVEQGRCRAVVLRGPGGVGKSRLARWLAQAAHERLGATMLTATHAPIAGPDDGLVPAIRRRLRAHGPAGVARGAWWLERLGEVRLAEAMVDRLLQADQASAGPVREVITALAAKAPVVLHVDDAQWAPDLLSWLAPLLDTRAAILIVVTVQDEAVGDREGFVDRLDGWLEDPSVRIECLGDLDLDAAMQLARGLTAVDGPLVTRLHDRTQGNPLHTVQLLMDWIDRRVVESSPRGLRLVPNQPVGMDGDLIKTWRRRLDRHLAQHSPQAQLALELAAVMGREVVAEEWAELCADAGITVPWELVDELLDSAMLRGEGEAGWAWAHGLLREVLFGMARAEGRLERHHQRMADLLEERGGDMERRARHLLAAGADARALPLLLESAERANRQGRQAAAIAMLHDHVAAALRQGLAPSDPQVVQARTLGAITAFNERRLDEAVTLGEDAVLRARMGARTDQLLRALGAWASPLALAGRRAEARQVLAEAAAIAHEQGDPEGVAEVQTEIAELLIEEGDLDGARRTAEAILGDARLQERTRVVVHDTLSRVALRSGDLDAAGEHVAIIRDFAERTGRRSWSAMTWNMSGEVARRRGRLDEARKYYEEAQRQLHAVGARVDTIVGNLALLDLMQGLATEALGRVELLRTEAARRGSSAGDVVLYDAIRCWACIQLRDLPAAWAALYDVGLPEPRAGADHDLVLALEHAQEASSFLGDAALEDHLDGLLSRLAGS